MRTLGMLFALVVVAAGCNRGDLVEGAEATPDPEESATPEPQPTETPGEPGGVVTPPPTPLPTPVPCSFYGIGAGGDLWRVDPAAPSAALVGNSLLQNTSDLAVTADGKMIVITLTAAYQLDPTTAQAYPYASAAWVQGQNSLDVTPDNRMLVGGGGSLTFIGAGPQFDVLPFGSAAWAGDVAVMGSIAYGSAIDNWEGNDHLIRIDLVTGDVAQHGQFSVPNVFGLDAACDGTLYAISQGDPDTGTPPRVFTIDPNSGSIATIGDLIGPTRLWGAAGPVVPPS